MTKINLQDNIHVKFLSYNPFVDADITKTIWLTLLNKCQHSYFTSWGWISTWLDSLPKDIDIQLIAGYQNDEPVTAFFIGRHKRTKYKFIPTKSISLNTTADRYLDKLTIEYNSILIDPTYHLRIGDLLDYMYTLKWDEFCFPGISSNLTSDFNLLADNGDNFRLIIDETRNSFFVELQKIRDAKMDYLQLLSSNKRSQIRRSIKQYELEGNIEVHAAENAEEALLMLDRLSSLHQQEWTKRGENGAFSNKYLFQFHKDLIRSRFDNHEIQLLHIYNEKRTIGYLYNFVYHDNVLFYQSGLNYSAENIYRPGLVSHYFAIMHNAKAGLATYDFLAGDSTYKSSLSTNSTPMYWARLIKNHTRYEFEKSIIKIKQVLKNKQNKNTLKERKGKSET